MRKFIVGCVVGAAFGIAGALLFRANTPPSETQTRSIVTEKPPEAPSLRPSTLEGPHGDDDIRARIALMEADLRRLADALAVVANRAAEVTGSSTPAAAPITATSVDTIRKTWSESLDEWERKIRAREAEEGSSPVLESRRRDLQRARAALDAAQSLEDVRRLAEGEFKDVFKLR
jgi:gas vesicle protein